MNMTLRWYGTGFDTVTLKQIRQIPGVTGVITTLYDSVPGEAWETEKILSLKKEVEDAGLLIHGIESVNVSDAIKVGHARPRPPYRKLHRDTGTARPCGHPHGLLQFHARF